jgi:DNA-binding IclR family transcriptional regulator
MNPPRNPKRLKVRDGNVAPLGTQTIQRAVAVLRGIAATGGEGVRLSELARMLGLERPTAHRIVQGLVAQGMVRQDAQSRLYQLGHVVYELGLAASPSCNLREFCEPTLRLLAQKTGDAIFLMVRSGLDAVCLDRIEGSYPVQARTLNVGGRRPLGMGAGSLALLMTCQEADIERILAANAARFPAFGHTTPDRVRAAIARSHQLGYAHNDQDVLSGISAIGTSLDIGEIQPCAAISIAGIFSRFEEERRAMLADLLLREARQLERRLMTEDVLSWR